MQATTLFTMMPFRESTKLEAKRRAHFQCVACRSPFVQVHHIVPQSEGGSDHIDNAAPLCARCHDLVGNNPDKRKQVREMRDLWWEICAKRDAHPDMLAAFKRMDELKAQIEAGHQELLAELRTTVATYFEHKALDVASANTLSEIIKASSSSS